VPRPHLWLRVRQAAPPEASCGPLEIISHTLPLPPLPIPTTQEWEFAKIEKILAGGAMAVD
jgi:hypothetical protein